MLSVIEYLGALRIGKPLIWLNLTLGNCTLEGWLVHAGHAGAVVLTWETMDMNLQRDRANRRAEVKQTHLFHREEERARKEI